MGIARYSRLLFVRRRRLLVVVATRAKEVGGANLRFRNIPDETATIDGNEQ